MSATPNGNYGRELYASSSYVHDMFLFVKRYFMLLNVEHVLQHSIFAFWILI